MQAVFAQAVAARKKRWDLAALCWREFSTLPVALVNQHWEHFLERLQGGTIPTRNEFTVPSSKREALLGALPFLAFGLVSMWGKLDIPIHDGYFWLGFYFLILVGLLAGWVKSFPRWAYAYLGWALIFAWWWTNMRTNGLNLFGHIFAYNESWGWFIWSPLAGIALLALAWTRSLRPIRQFFLGIWNDWTRLSFILFAFPAWISLIYDENHHPYLLLFMLGSTLAFTIGAYIFGRLANSFLRILCLVTGTLTALGFAWECDATWDFRAYYDLPLIHEPWYVTVLRWSTALMFIALFLFGPGVLALLRKGLSRLKV